MSLWTRLLEKALGAILDRALNKPTKAEEPSAKLGDRDVIIQNRASHVPEAHKLRGMSARCASCGESFKWLSDFDQHMPVCGLIPQPSSPRAITQRYAIPPPPPSARRKR